MRQTQDYADPATEPSEAKAPRPKPIFKIAVLVVIAIIVILVGAHFSGRGQKTASAASRTGAAQGPRAIPVAVATVQQNDVPVYLSGLGNVNAYYTVALHTRVDGQLMKVNFREGQDVHKGEELALVDPRPYEVQLSQAEANRYRDQSLLDNANRDLQRFTDLYRQGIISQQQYNAQQSSVGQYEGAVRADDAAIQNAKLNITYCHVTSPIDGRIGMRLVDPGNMVHASDQNPLLVVTELQPIAVMFTLPEDNLPAVAHCMQQGGSLAVEAWTRDNTQKVATGRLETFDNQIDPNTGTFRLKAIFDNRDHALWPNQFVNARLQLQVDKNALTLPAAAIQRGVNGTYVYLVKKDNTVAAQPVTVAFTEGTLTAIAKGVNPGDVIVTDGQDKLQPGSKIEPRATTAAPSVTPSDQVMAPSE
jgi:multidrug efflux system membrane fusion protein